LTAWPRLAAIATALGSVGALVLTAAAAPAAAAITPTRDALLLAGATGAPSGTTADFLTLPSSQAGEPHGVASLPLPGFPRAGATFPILTTGDVSVADDPNISGSSGLDLFGPSLRGDSDFDVSVLRLGVPVTASDNCLSFEFRLLSEEFPEYQNSSYNDAFLAELRSSTWTTSGGVVSAPNNFALDAAGNPVTIDAEGEIAAAPSRAVATTYDAASRVARATAPLNQDDRNAGRVDLYLSIFDQGDGGYDSAALVDRLVVDNRSECQVGARVIDSSDPQTSATKPKLEFPKPPDDVLPEDLVEPEKPEKPAKPRKATVRIKFSSSEAGSTFFCRFVKLGKTSPMPYAPCAPPFKSKVREDRRYGFEVVAVDAAGNPDPAPVSLNFKASEGSEKAEQK